MMGWMRHQPNVPLKPLIKKAEVDRLDNMNQKRITNHDSHQKAVKLRGGGHHSKGIVQMGDMRNSYDEAADKSCRGNNREGGS